MKTMLSVYLPIDISGYHYPNKFITQLVSALEENGCNVSFGLFRLLQDTSKYHIVNFQWPEAIFGWRSPTLDQLEWLDRRLDAISKGSIIVSTVHNLLPHYNNDKSFVDLYKLLYKYSSCFIHLYHTSIHLLKDAFPNQTTEKVHRVIHHGNYSALGSRLEKGAARQRLGLSEHAHYVSVLGELRDEEELFVIFDALKNAKRDKWQMLFFSRFGFLDYTSTPGFVSRIATFVTRKYYFRKLISREVAICKPGFIPDSEMSNVLSATDVLLIPRTQILNSGNVALGFSFGNIVVGPNVGNVGTQLKDTGNPTFEPDKCTGSVSDAINSGFLISKLGHGESNLRYAENELSWHNIGRDYVRLFTKLPVN